MKRPMYSMPSSSYHLACATDASAFYHHQQPIILWVLKTHRHARSLTHGLVCSLFRLAHNDRRRVSLTVWVRPTCRHALILWYRQTHRHVTIINRSLQNCSYCTFRSCHACEVQFRQAHRDAIINLSSCECDRRIGMLSSCENDRIIGISMCLSNPVFNPQDDW